MSNTETGLTTIVSTDNKPNFLRYRQVLASSFDMDINHVKYLARKISERAAFDLVKNHKFFTQTEDDYGSVTISANLVVMTEDEWIDAMKAQYQRGQKDGPRSL